MWNIMGASVQGPQHRQDQQPNQDAWLGRLTRQGAVAVVCDGLGSRAHAAEGSRAACRAVAEAVRHWARIPDAPPDLLLRLVHALWNVRVHPTGRHDSATTCLFAATSSDGRLVLAQLGDGLILLKTPQGMTTLEPPSDRFGNATTGLGIAKDLRDWRIHVEPAITGDTMVMLATDGVADDLLPDKRGPFMRFLVDHHGSFPAARRSRAVARSLREWPTPRHLDDKTVAVLWRAAPVEIIS